MHTNTHSRHSSARSILILHTHTDPHETAITALTIPLPLMCATLFSFGHVCSSAESADEDEEDEVDDDDEDLDG